ncbi:MAG: polyribonucleotide nucleotidyltransferase [Planctomycetota bacterium]|jgi:polyribonucleotide nucleotidyltransferase|nr:polyribonucleotide nucleotidyltransferase [Planctomycetota bacterium]MDP6838382.1 polyribonucleotide nucleotidyltransferase [Planctomycetota bacterium]
MTSKHIRVEREIAGQTLSIETGQVARQAHGSVIVTYGGSMIFAAVTCGGARDDLDFFPLTVDYREKTEAAGKIPGGFFKREGRPTTKEVLTMRMIDRSIRPMFSDGFRQEVQVMTHALCYDEVNNTDVLAMIGAFAALRISGMPFDATLGAMRVSQVDGELVGLPTEEQRGDASRLDLMVSGHKDGICMVESSAQELSEDDMIDALEFGHERILEIVSLLDELGDKAGKPEIEWSRPDTDDSLADAVSAYGDDLRQAMATDGKHERYAAMDVVKKNCVEALTNGVTDEKDLYKRTKAVKNAFRDLVGSTERAIILDGKRIDGRAYDEIREITIVPDFIPRQHGSVLFTRGETQALVSTTLGTPDDEQIIDGIDKEYRKNFYLHYNFPPYSVGETRRIMGPGRREIGHGMLAERSLTPVLPAKDQFPYTIRVVSDITESNGSSSMASVCGGCISMMCAGVPLSQPIAGIAMGLVQEGDQTAILSDILGSEDHHGDMDFKVAGSGIGITALQMDIKIKGVSRELLQQALGQANAGRRHILKIMLDAVSQPRAETSEHAPKMSTVMIPSEKIGFLIGPGGKNIKAMQADYECRISIVDDSGRVQIYGTNGAKVRACEDAIKGMCETPEIGSRYNGTVKAIKDFGAFIEILPGVEGLCHISELAEGFVERVDEVVKMGDAIDVKVIAVDDRGKVKLSHKAVLQEA